MKKGCGVQSGHPRTVVTIIIIITPHRGASIKTRKRNIAVPLDPGSFANALVQIFEDSREANASVEKNLEAAGKVLDSAELDFKRYGDTFFEVLYAGGRMLGGGNLAEGPKLDTNVRGDGVGMHV